MNVDYAGFGGASSTINGSAVNVSGAGMVSASIGAIGANTGFTVNLGDIVNTDNDSGDETITLTFRAVALNTTGNVAGAAGVKPAGNGNLHRGNLSRSRPSSHRLPHAAIDYLIQIIGMFLGITR